MGEEMLKGKVALAVIVILYFCGFSTGSICSNVCSFKEVESMEVTMTIGEQRCWLLVPDEEDRSNFDRFFITTQEEGSYLSLCGTYFHPNTCEELGTQCNLGGLDFHSQTFFSHENPLPIILDIQQQPLESKESTSTVTIQFSRNSLADNDTSITVSVSASLSTTPSPSPSISSSNSPSRSATSTQSVTRSATQSLVSSSTPSPSTSASTSVSSSNLGSASASPSVTPTKSNSVSHSASISVSQSGGEDEGINWLFLIVVVGSAIGTIVVCVVSFFFHQRKLSGREISVFDFMD